MNAVEIILFVFAWFCFSICAAGFNFIIEMMTELHEDEYEIDANKFITRSMFGPISFVVGIIRLVITFKKYEHGK